jgi:hypothetical protein
MRHRPRSAALDDDHRLPLRHPFGAAAVGGGSTRYCSVVIAVDASLIEVDANKQRSLPGEA